MIVDEHYFELLKEKYERNLLKRRLIILSGEEGLGQEYTLERFISFAAEHGMVCIDLAYIPGIIPLSSVWNSLKNYMDISNMYMNGNATENHMQYMEFLFSRIVNLCKEGEKILFYSPNIMKCDDILLCFIENIMEYILPKYDGIFLCCSYIDKKVNSNIMNLLSQHCFCVTEIPFSRWDDLQLKKMFEEIFGSKIKIKEKVLKQILTASLGNPNRLKEIADYLISESIIFKKEDYYTCNYFDEEILFAKTKKYIINRYHNLNAELQTIVKGSSIIGSEFQSKLLKNPLHLQNVDSCLREIEKITHFIYQKKDFTYVFYNRETYLSIKEIVGIKERTDWCNALAEYYYNEAGKNIVLNNNIVSCNYYLSSAYYYTEIYHYEKVIFIYYKIITILMSLMQYEQVLYIIEKLQDISEQQQVTIPHILKENLTILRATCLYSIFHFEEAAEEYKKYIEITKLDTLEYQKILCQQAICLYSTGQTEQPYQMLMQLYNQMSNQKITIENVGLFVNVLSNLSSVEETLRLGDCSTHFNLALSYAHDYNLTALYYSLLRKSFIVHSGINYMQMLEAAKKYYKKNGAFKDYAMTIHNQASFYLLYGELDKVKVNCQEAIEIFTEMGSDAVHYTYNCMGMYYCMSGNFHEALVYFRLAYKERYELFSKIVILLNQTTTHIKLNNYDCANQIIKNIEHLWTNDEAETFRILKPYHYLIRAEFYQKTTNMQEAYKSYMNYFECEDEINDYRFVFAANKFYQLCCNSNRTFPTELKATLKSGNAIAARLLDIDMLPVHLMFAE